MSTRYKFVGLPGNSSVAGFVTLAVSAWFLVAGAAIILDDMPPAPSPGAAGATAVLYTAPAVAISPEARLIIVVEGRRA
jgi:hypothetical protein